MISMEDYLWFVDRTLGQMAAIVDELGDDLASTRPDLPGANSPYGILTHCLGVMEGWGGHFVAGRAIVRDRDAEFGATGPVDALLARIPTSKAAFARDVATADLTAPLRNAPNPGDAGMPFGQSQGSALFHVYEELSQHLGQMELTRDILIASR